MEKIITFRQLMRYCFVEYIKVLYSCKFTAPSDMFDHLRERNMHNGICFFISSLTEKELITKTNCKKWFNMISKLAFVDYNDYLFETPSDVRYNSKARHRMIMAMWKRVLWLYFMTELTYYEQQITDEEIRTTTRRVTKRRK